MKDIQTKLDDYLNDNEDEHEFFPNEQPDTTDVMVDFFMVFRFI